MTNEERDSVIMEKLNEGMSLSDVQKLLESQYGLRMTYLDLRLLAADLQVNWEKQDKPKAAEKPAPAAPAPAAPAPEETAEPLDNDEKIVDDETEDDDQIEDEPAASGETQVELDESPIPGTVASGTVKFASGASGKWAVMRGGRLGFEADEGSAEPTEDDFAQFQVELRRKMMGEDEPEDPNAGPTVVDVDAVVRPGVRLSGTVKFSSGASGKWMIDMQGQFGLEPDEGSAKPTRRDIVKFQQELQKVLAQKGYN